MAQTPQPAQWVPEWTPGSINIPNATATEALTPTNPEYMPIYANWARVFSAADRPTHGGEWVFRP